jgi:ATP-binding cassette subfamily C exporter for protease/lipase
MINQKVNTEIITAFKAEKKMLKILIMFSILISLLSLSPTLYMLSVYDRVINSGSEKTLLVLTIIILITYAGMELLEVIRYKIIEIISMKVQNTLLNRVYEAMFQGYLNKKLNGVINAINDLKIVSNFLSNPAFLAILELPLIIISLIILFEINVIMGLAAMTGGLLQIIIAYLNQRSTYLPLLNANQSYGDSIKYATSVFKNAQVIEAMGMEGAIYNKWKTKQNEYVDNQAIASKHNAYWMSITKLLQLILSSFIIGIGAKLMMRDNINVSGGLIIVASILGGRILSPLGQIITSWKGVVSFQNSWKRLNLLLEHIPKKMESMPLPSPKGSLQVENVNAAAPGQQIPIIKNLDFNLGAGEALAIVGQSASGKTTLARLLVGLWSTISGRVRLDGVDINSWNKSEVGPYIGYLPQYVEVLDGTIAENIARFGEVNQAMVEEAASLVGLHEYILALPDGYSSALGIDGVVLSGGFKQRIGFARAIYGRPVFVVLDEPNSNLDKAGDEALIKTIEHMKKTGTTFVIITHKTNIFDVIDKILILKNGTLQLYGPKNLVIEKINENRNLMNTKNKKSESV